MTSLTVSVIVPTHQRPAELQRALASVEAQTRQPDEVIVLEDTRSAGAAATRNAGAARSTGDLLAFLDDDDEWHPEYLRTVLDMIERRRLAIVCTDLLLRRTGESERPGKPAPESLWPRDFLTRNPGLGGSNTVVRRELFDAIGGFNPTLPTLNDMDFGLRIALARPRYLPNHRPLVIFNHHSGPRLSIAGSTQRRKGLVRFFALHGDRMTPAQRDTFRARMRREGVGSTGCATL